MVARRLLHRRPWLLQQPRLGRNRLDIDGGRDVAQTDASSGDDGDESQPSSAFPPLDDGGAFPPLDQDASSSAGGDGAAGMPSPLNPVGNVPLASGSSTLPGNTGQGQDETPAAGPGGRQVFELPGSRPAAGLDTSPLVMPEEGTNGARLHRPDRPAGRRYRPKRS
ncbi:MAG: hypothetical protein R3B96_07490 [Pirellulaceae bacterium]